MARGPGRDQRGPMERLVRIAATLHDRGSVGETGQQLARIAGFAGDGAADQVAREVRALNKQGWQIENIAPSGEPARYRMRTVDNRLRVRLTPAQQRALRRAVLLADRSDLAERLGLDPDTAAADDLRAAVPARDPDAALATVLRAVRRGSRIRFSYKGSARVVHPESVRAQNGTWYLRGVEDSESDDGAAPVKAFVVARMSDVDADHPGTARPVQAARHPGLHPMSWEIDPPVEVTLRTTADYLPDVRRWLGPPAAEEPDGDGPDGDRVVVRYRVTHRAALRARLHELGRRVVLLGPDDVRRELLAELEETARTAS